MGNCYYSINMLEVFKNITLNNMITNKLKFFKLMSNNGYKIRIFSITFYIN